MTKGQICFLNEYCTDCPIREECNIRPLFYSEDLYQKYKEETIKKTTLLAKGLGFPESFIPTGLNFHMEMMDKRKDKELELHSTYSK